MIDPSIFLALCNGNVDLAWIVYVIAHVLLIVAGLAIMTHYTYKIDKDAIDNW